MFFTMTTTTSPSCKLCHALQHDQFRTVYADHDVFVLINVEPIKNGHLMVLPVRHVEQLSDLTQEESRAFLRLIDRCMAALTEAFHETPMCLMNGSSYRTQPHLHAHILPSKKDLRGLYAAAEGLEERKRADKETLTRMADRMRPFFEPVG
jgi:diadenosine tetraphosphate (Ap4A) HIT family hydrolase